MYYLQDSTVVRAFKKKEILNFRDRLVKHPESYQSLRYGRQMSRDTINGTGAPSPPTFRQFVEFLLSTPPEEMDSHWQPFWLHCAPCIVDYDAVIKVQ